MAVGADPSATSRQVYTAVWQTTLASNSGTATSGQVVDVTQITTRGYGAANTTPAFLTSSIATPGAGAASNSAHSTNALVVILVPVLVVAALIVPCVLILLRIRRRRSVRFMSTYEDLTGHNTSDIEYQDALRRPYADTLGGRDSESPFPYDMASIPSASMVHLDMAQGSRTGSAAAGVARADSRARSSPRLVSPVEDPFADRAPDESDAHAPLFAAYSSAPRTRSPSSASSVRPASRWGTLSPVSRRGAYSPAPTDSRAGSRNGHSPLVRGHSKHYTDGSVDLTTPFEWDGMEDPFADPNRHGAE